MSTGQCENCGNRLVGPYCAQCGQHAHASARSLPALLHDAWHDLTHIEGRLWATLWRLMCQPGRLTLDYFAGQRARYAPPFRMYLVLSVVFFGLSSFADRLDPQHSHSVQMHSESGNRTCTDVHASPASLERFFKRACERMVVDDGASIAHTFRSYVPKSMFVFLPLVAGVLALLYRRPKRYYVEHLVFVLHNHAAIFAAMGLLSVIHLLTYTALYLDLSIWHRALDGVSDLLSFTTLFVYAPWYVYRALRNFYGLPRGATLRRLIPLGFSYLLFLIVTFALTFLLSVILA